MKRTIIKSGLIASLLLIVIYTACKKDNSNNNNNNKTASVAIANFAFSPTPLTITNGTTVTWTNNDTAPHTVTATDSSFTSGTLSKGDSYSHTFSSAGTVNYFCKVHPMMKAAVVVQ